MLREIRVAARHLRTRQTFTAVAIATLAVGIGANAAIFAVINEVILRPLPYPRSDRLVSVYTRYLPSTGYDYPYFALSGPEFADVRDRVDGFSEIAAYQMSFRNVLLQPGAAERVLTTAVTEAFFELLAVRSEFGRTIGDADVRPQAGCVAVLEYEMWRRGLGASQDVVGTTIRLDDMPCEVVGVMPEGFGFGDPRVRIWTALAVDEQETPINRNSHPLVAVARLRDGFTSEQAEAQLQSLHSYWSERHPDHYAKGHFAVIRPLHEDVVGDQRQALLLLGGAVLFVLMIVCINLSGLLVSHGEARRREFAVRRALGADRKRLVRQLLVETMLLAVAGGGIGVVLANWMLEALLAFYPDRLPVWRTIAIDYQSVIYGLGLVLVTGLVVGLLPALHVTGVRLAETLKADARAATDTRRAVVARSALVVGQLALSLVVLVSTLLLIRTYQYLQRVDLGIDAEGVLTFTISIPEGRQPDAGAARRTVTAISERLSSLPGVQAAGAVSSLPLVSAGPPDDFIIVNRAAPPAGSPAWNARYILATPPSFEALGIPLVKGRGLAQRDVPGQPLVAVINETAARLYWPADDPVGRYIRYFPRETSPAILIVGIVGDVRSLGPDAPPPPAVYVAYEQAPRPDYAGRSVTFAIRVSGDPMAIVPSVREVVQLLDAGLPVANVRPMSTIVDAAIGQPRFTSIVMSFFALSAWFLAVLGLYGTLTYAMQQRTREIGLRIALGAGNREILRLIVGNGLGLSALGILAGIAAALMFTPVMSGLLAGVESADPLTYLTVVTIFGITAMVASYLPARRATRLDPMVALRTE